MHLPQHDTGPDGVQQELRRVLTEEVLVTETPSLAYRPTFAQRTAGSAFGPVERDMGEEQSWFCKIRVHA